ncbi:Transient receptor potential cation channel subfamily A member 1 [Trichoplax sp. H2]|nr:Transient receptor potential cation channel subfamily A member 1 [Trichoplax sp. H2]|eukprot:RDD41697.1 Transient receptor potential cation channel subfamily A member 1 [Trichoplax sp. H2]
MVKLSKQKSTLVTPVQNFLSTEMPTPVMPAMAPSSEMINEGDNPSQPKVGYKETKIGNRFPWLSKVGLLNQNKKESKEAIGSLVSIGIAAAGAESFGDIYEAARLGYVDDLISMLQVSYYKERINYPDKDNYTLMHYAARHNNDQVVGCLIKHGADVNAKGGRDLVSPLHLAAQHNAYQSAEVLLMHDAAIDAEDKNKSTPLHRSCQYNNVKISQLILLEARRQGRAKSIVNRPNNENTCPLHCAAFYGSREACDALVYHGANMSKKDACSKTAIHIATMAKNIEVAQYLMNHAKMSGKLSYMRIIDQNGYTPLHIAVDSGSLELTELCLKYDASVEDQTYEMLTPIHLACVNGFSKIAELLIKHGCNVNAMDNRGRNAFHKAAISNNTEIIRLIHQNGGYIEASDSDLYTPLLAAAYHGCKESLQHLINCKANLFARHINGRNVLHIVAERNHGDIMRYLIEHGGEMLINCPDDDGIMPIFAAAHAGAIATINVLKEYSARTDLFDNNNNSMIHVATKNNHRDTVFYILKHITQEVNLRNNYGQKPIHVAAINGHDRVLTLLIKYRSDLDSRDNFSYSPLHYAARGGFLSTAKLLIENDAKIDVTDKSGNTPLHLACANSFTDLANLLIDHNADPTLTNYRGQNCLDICIESNQSELGSIIVKSKYGEKVMENRAYDGYSPMKRLIERLPAVAKDALDKCVILSKNTMNDSKQVTFDFRYLESSPEDKQLKEVKDKYLAVKSMLKYERNELMRHPVVAAYRHFKWNAIMKYIYYGDLLLKIIFLLGVVIPITLNARDYLNYRIEEVNKDPNLTSANIYQGYFINQMIVERNIIVFLAVCIALSSHLALLLSSPKLFFKSGLFMLWQIVIEGFTLFYCMPFDMPVFPLSIQVGAMIVLLLLITFMFNLRRAYGIGIYLSMFFTIIKTILKASITIYLFIFAFALAFYMLLTDMPMFSEFHFAIFRVMTMMAGDISFEEVFNYMRENNRMQTAGTVFAVITLVVIFINIAFANLLVGLAVGDIAKVRQSADLAIIRMDIKFILDLQHYHFPSCVRNKLYKPSLILHVDNNSKLFERRDWNKLTAILDLSKDSQESNDNQELDIKTLHKEVTRQQLDVQHVANLVQETKTEMISRFIIMESKVNKILTVQSAFDTNSQ